jgi:hypothetical protein
MIGYLCFVAFLGANLGALNYRQGGDESAPGGTQPARLLFRALPLGALATLITHDALLGALVSIAAFLGLLVLPHGNFQSMGAMPPNLKKFPVALMLRLGIPYNVVACFIGMSVIGAGRLALLVAPLMDPMMFAAAAFGWLHALAYLIGLRTAPWNHPMLKGPAEIGELLWGLGQGVVFALALAFYAA